MRAGLTGLLLWLLTVLNPTRDDEVAALLREMAGLYDERCRGCGYARCVCGRG